MVRAGACRGRRSRPGKPRHARFHARVRTSHASAAVDPEDLAGDPGAVAGDEEDGRFADVVGLAGTTERDGLNETFAEEADQLLPHVRADETGRDAVHADALGCDFL